MSNIQQALNNLYQTMGSLETAADEQEQVILHLKQQDLFREEAAAANVNENKIDQAVLAQKLDSAISKIENVLSEG